MDGQLRVATDPLQACGHPLLPEALAWHGFQLREQPLSCQAVPVWLKRMRDRQLALPLGPGLLDPGWLEAQGLELHPDQPPLLGGEELAEQE